jgi:putative PIN family toxin of toxin-antitoxin system
MLRVTLDSSEYISALQFNGRVARLLRMAADNDIEIAISEPIIAEVIGVLRERFGWDGYRLHAERERIKSITKFVTPSETLDVIDYDPPDNRILECAADAGSEFIVSEDKDLLRLKEHGTARIIRAAEMLDIVQGKRGRTPGR